MNSEPRTWITSAAGVILLAVSAVLVTWAFDPASEDWEASWSDFRASHDGATLKRLVRQDDFCATARFLQGREVPGRRALAAVFLPDSPFSSEPAEDAGLHGLLGALLEPTAERALTALGDNSGEAAIFYRAMILGGWIDTLRPKRLDLMTSLSLLREVSARSPSNGALGVYEAALLRRMGARPLEVLARLSEAFATGRLDTYHATLSRALLLRASANPSRFLVGVELQERLPAPDIQAIWTDLLPLIAEYGSHRLTEAAIKFSRSTLRSTRLRRPEPESWAAALERARGSPPDRCERRGVERLVAAEVKVFRRELASAGR